MNGETIFLASLAAGSLAISSAAVAMAAITHRRTKHVAAREARKQARMVIGTQVHEMAGKCRLLEIDVRLLRHAGHVHGQIKGHRVLPARVPSANGETPGRPEIE